MFVLIIMAFIYACLQHFGPFWLFLKCFMNKAGMEWKNKHKNIGSDLARSNILNTNLQGQRTKDKLQTQILDVWWVIYQE